MNEQTLHNQQPLLKQTLELGPRAQGVFAALLPGRTLPLFYGIGHRLTLLVVGLVTLLTLATAFLVINIMGDVLLRSMIKRGAVNAHAIASSAGYSILSDDRLALDNLAAQTQQSQNDVSYVAILDGSRHILAHSQLGQADASLPQISGELLENDGLLRVDRVVRKTQTVYEFSLPIDFARHRLGAVIIGINPQSLVDARSSAHWRIMLVASFAILCGTEGALFLARLFTRPITHLSAGVERLKSGSGKVSVPVLADDELGELARNFSTMATDLATQRLDLLAAAADLEKSYYDIVQLLAGALDARDNYTYGHSARVARLAVKLGTRLKLNKEELKELEISCLLHDIGKIKVPDSILNKQAALDETEHACIREHPRHGAEILRLADSLHRYIPTVEHHHEWYNGQGYPDGLRADQIPLNAQIIAIADAYDAMKTSRPYRKGLPCQTAITEILRQRESQFSPQLTDLFSAAMQEQPDSATYGTEC